jgi:hypothetical protein
MYFFQLPDLIIARVAGHVGFPECVVKMRDSGLCADVADIVDNYWTFVRRIGKRHSDRKAALGSNRKKGPMTRLYVFENGTPTKVVIRSRGAANIMCLWDISSGNFQIGQWVCKRPLVPERCSFLPDGRFVWVTRQFGCSLTIGVSTPPFFTAHAVWEGMRCQTTTPAHITSSPACSLTWKEIVDLQQSNGSGPTTTIPGNILRHGGELIHDFSHDSFQAVPPPAGYLKGTPSKEEEERVATCAENMRRWQEEQRLKAESESARWRCSHCTTSYNPNQTKRIQAHVSAHGV